MMQYQDQELTRQIIGTAIEVHKNLGPGLLESVYRICMCFELENRGLSYLHESMVPLVYKNRKLDCGFRMDFLIEDKVILELKAVESILPVHGSQLLTYTQMISKIGFWRRRLRSKVFVCSSRLASGNGRSPSPNDEASLGTPSHPKNLRGLLAKFPIFETICVYLRLMNRQVGLLINFNVPILKKGVRRCVLNAVESDIVENFEDIPF